VRIIESIMTSVTDVPKTVCSVLVKASTERGIKSLFF